MSMYAQDDVYVTYDMSAVISNQTRRIKKDYKLKKDSNDKIINYRNPQTGCPHDLAV